MARASGTERDEPVEFRHDGRRRRRGWRSGRDRGRCVPQVSVVVANSDQHYPPRLPGWRSLRRAAAVPAATAAPNDTRSFGPAVDALGRLVSLRSQVAWHRAASPARAGAALTLVVAANWT